MSETNLQDVKEKEVLDKKSLDDLKDLNQDNNDENPMPSSHQEEPVIEEHTDVLPQEEKEEAVSGQPWIERRDNRDEPDISGLGLKASSCIACLGVLHYSLIVYFVGFQCCYVDANSTLAVDASCWLRKIPDTFLGAFIEEINHAGAGGIWAELVSNRGFEAGNITNTHSDISPWSIIGNETFISVSTNAKSCFRRNKIALHMAVHCGDQQPCPSSGVGISNPGYWGMNIEKGKKYKVIYHVSTTGNIDLQISFTGVDVVIEASNTTHVYKHGTWRRVETILEAKSTNHNSSLHITTTTNGAYLLDQVSVMPLDTYMGHGFRNDLFQMVANLKPKFLRFPGGTYVEGNYLKNQYRWKNTIGPWTRRPGHLNDIWNYWSDDGLGIFEYLQLAEDLGALPVWVFNAGISRHGEVKSSVIWPYVQDALDGIEFARGSTKLKWGAFRAAMGHPNPFDLRYVAIGNEDCDFLNYQDSKTMFSKSTQFDNTSRSGPKAFVSEYAVVGNDAGNGSLLSAVAEAAFLIGLEKNSDIVQMVSYAPLFLNINDRKWIPDAILFDSYQVYATPSYWVQKFFIESSGATLLGSTFTTTSSNALIASAITWKDSTDTNSYLRIKVVNFGNTSESLNIFINGLNSSVQQYGSSKTVLTSTNVMDENSFLEPFKVVPQKSYLEKAENNMNTTLSPYSVTSFDLLLI
ncbi:hypothetical protein RJT34_11902 [Clitoria ternatea]|uniref:non-reducing end alpha-L-arabinofuranosidase n=1 Tax=Clitoria ternatea TaxID=43366 RepID=A0AAN9JMP6_CLITE